MLPSSNEAQHTGLDLRCNFDPEPLSIGIVEIDDFCKEYDNGRAPEYCMQFNSYHKTSVEVGRTN